MKNVNDVNDISLINTREEKKDNSNYTNNFSKTRYIVDKKKDKKFKYFLDEIDGIAYYTNDYSLYYWHNKIFYDFDVHLDRQFLPIPKPEISESKANGDTLKNAVKEEIAHYEAGYCYVNEWVINRGKKWKKGRWVRNPEKAKEKLEKIYAYKNRGRDFFK